MHFIRLPNQLQKAGIVETADAQLKSKQAGKKTNKLRGIPKLEDANEAGTKNASG